jgi:hypothetical protein
MRWNREGGRTTPARARHGRDWAARRAVRGGQLLGAPRPRAVPGAPDACRRRAASSAITLSVPCRPTATSVPSPPLPRLSAPLLPPPCSFAPPTPSPCCCWPAATFHRPRPAFAQRKAGFVIAADVALLFTFLHCTGRRRTGPVASAPVPLAPYHHHHHDHRVNHQPERVHDWVSLQARPRSMIAGPLQSLLVGGFCPHEQKRGKQKR